MLWQIYFIQIKLKRTMSAKKCYWGAWQHCQMNVTMDGILDIVVDSLDSVFRGRPPSTQKSRARRRGAAAPPRHLHQASF